MRTARAVCLTMLTGCGGSLLGWGAQHHQRQVEFLGGAVAVLSLAAMWLTLKVER